MSNNKAFGRGVRGSFLLVMVSGAALAGSPPSVPPTLTHELFLIVTGAILGGLLGPILQIVDSWLGLTPGSKQMRANYEVQREIAATLLKLVEAQQPPASPQPPP